MVRRKVNIQLIIFQLLSFGSFAPMNYYNVYLKALDFSSTEIGIWGAVSSIIAMATLPVWGIISDKIGSPKKPYLVSMVVYAVLFALLPTVGKMTAVSYMPLYILIVFYSVVKQPTHSLQDSWFISTGNLYNINYSSVRLWGSFGFAVVSIFNGIITQYVETSFVFYLAPLMIAPLFILCTRFKYDEKAKAELAEKEPPAPKAERVKMRPWVLFKNYYLMTAFIMTIVLGCYQALIVPFYPFILESANSSPDRFGLISGYGAFVQVGAMLLMSRFCKKVPLPALLVAAGFFSILENLTYSMASSIWMLFVASTFWGIAISINVTILPMYIYSLVPKEYSSTAISFSATVMMMLTIIGNFIGGYLVDSVGVSAYTSAIALLIFVLVLLFMLSLLIGRKVLKITPPNHQQIS